MNRTRLAECEAWGPYVEEFADNEELVAVWHELIAGVHKLHAECDSLKAELAVRREQVAISTLRRIAAAFSGRPAKPGKPLERPAAADKLGQDL